MTYYKEAFRVLLDRFALEVKQGKYKKLDYNLWRDLYGLAKMVDGSIAEISENWENNITLDILPHHSDRTRHYEFEMDDGSLGEYLAEELRMANLKSCKLECNIATFNEPTANNNVLTFNTVTNGLAYGKYELDPCTATTWDFTIATQEEVAAKASNEDLNQVKKRVEELGRIATKDIIFEERKENNEMKGFNFDFGSCEGSNVRMSMYGMAVKNGSGTWVAYDKENEQIMDVDILNFEGAKYMYKLPVALKDIARGDVVIHNRRPMFVTGVANGKITAIDPFDGEEKVILLTRSPFGFDFATKVVCLFDGVFGKADAANPFGNMLPFLMMGDSDFDPMMLMLMGGKMDMSNPMMMYMLMKDGDKGNDMLPFLLMGMNNGCHCSCDCEKEG